MAVARLLSLLLFRSRLVRRLVWEINSSLDEGDLEKLRRLIREHPEEARRAFRYVRRSYKPILRRLLEEGGLKKAQPSPRLTEVPG